MKNPFEQFNLWWKNALADSPLKQKSAVCISTIDQHGFPSGRFVDLKEVNETGFIFCTYLDSAKGEHLKHNPKIAMTIWWDHVGYQIRVQGSATPINQDQALKYWKTRSKEAQLTTTAFQQSQTLDHEAELQTRIDRISQEYIHTEVPKPDAWGGYIIAPHSIEFLSFRESRLHLRELFTLSDDVWVKTLLQP
jgi:pyridoxamine 5'-phosphate oxidase